MQNDLHLKGYSIPVNTREYTLREIIFSPLPHRPENAIVIRGHIGEKITEVSLPQLRELVARLIPVIQRKGLKKGDTVLLASFYCSNELSNALLFAALACLGIRIFIPIYPEVNEFDHWQAQTKFRAVILPWRELMNEKGHEREKEVVNAIREKCRQTATGCWDPDEAFGVLSLLADVQAQHSLTSSPVPFDEDLSVSDEAVIFTTSGTTGNSKLVVYRQGAFSLCCQCWQAAGLFAADQCGNPGFTPLFTHTIGIRNFINALWSGQPVCLVVVDWFLQKPEVARYLLLQMQPGHIVGGPALFNTLLELFRQFPDLKIRLRQQLKTIISIGAPYNTNTARQVKTALGLTLFNAFGTTETQMVLLNRTQGNLDDDPTALGQPLPGVSVKLTETEQKGVYEMHLMSPYQSSYVLWEAGHSTWFSTGDLVTCDEQGTLRYAGRKGQDFIKDDFGVKVPLAFLREYYPFLNTLSLHVEWLPLDHKPGLAALVFLKSDIQPIKAKELSERIKCRNEELETALQPFEFSHRHLERISLVNEAPPLTRKGTVSRKDIHAQYEEIISALRNPYVAEQRIESVEAGQHTDQYKFSDPRLSLMLEALKLDVDYYKASGDHLWYKRDGKDIKVLDLVGGFGAGLHGHHHPALKEAILSFLQSDRSPINTQGSRYHYPSLLAKELNRIFALHTGRYFKVQLANTGSEAMEIALHHAYFAWWAKLEKFRDEQLQLYGSVPGMDVAAVWERNMRKAARASAALLLVNNCFHGYSSGARSLLNAKKQRHYFSGLLKPVPLHISDTDPCWKEKIREHLAHQYVSLQVVAREQDGYVLRQEPYSTIIASVAEPVRGEGGIYETGTDLLDELSRQPFPLIADEIQCGLGRTGQLPAYSRADYYLLGKSLGGGYEKIAAVLIDDEQFKPAFPQYYTTTFGHGEMAACTALKALQLIEEGDYAGIAARKGAVLKEKLIRVAEAYPDIIASIQGKGLMLGIHFSDQVGKQHNLLRILRETELLGYLLAGWMLSEKRIRVLPSLSKPNSIRVEPSVMIGPGAMDECCAALETFCQHCRDNQVYALTRFLMNGDPYLDKMVIDVEGLFPQEVEAPLPGALPVGFIGNFTIPPKELAVIEPDLQQASETGLRILFSKMQALLDGKAVKLIGKNLMKGRVCFTFYIVPYDTAHLEVIHRWGKKRYYISKIQETVDKLVSEGNTHISLGAHTSILSGNGLFLAERKRARILTGNTLTVASCLYHLERYMEKRKKKHPGPLTIAIAGANGNIGSGLAGCLDDEKYQDEKIILAGTNIRKLELLRKKLFSPGRSVHCTNDLFALQQADILISCTSTNDPLIFSYHVHPDKKVFIIDIAVPGSVADEVKKMPNVEFYREASTVYLPDDPAFLISTHTPVGKMFCCSAEAILAALYDVREPLKGHIQPSCIRKMMALGMKEGLFNKKAYAPPV